jgi:hypothetical protein
MKPFRTAAAALAALALAASAAAAQGPDARVLPRGILEVRAFGTFTGFDERFDGGRDPLGTGFAALLQPRADTLAALGPLRQRLGAFFGATGAPVTPELSAGTVRALLAGDQRDVPFTFALGLTRRITVEATVPLVRQVTSVGGIYLAGGNVGVNPNAALNGRVLGRVDTAFAALGASGLLPVEGTPAAIALRARVVARGVADSLALPTRGVLISELLTRTGETGLSGAERAALTTGGARTGFALGDVQLGARMQLANTATAWGLPEDSLRGRGFRAAAGGRVRLPTGPRNGALYLLQLAPSTGHFGVGGDVAADWFLSRRWWVTAAADAEVLFPANATRLAFTAANPFPDTTQRRVLRREPGARFGATVTPRYRLTREISFAAQYAFASVGAVTYTGEGADLLGPLESTLAQTSHLLGLGASYTTVQGYAAGRAPFPAEVSLLYRTAVAGSGRAPVATVLDVGVRVFYPAFGRPRRARLDSAAAPLPAPADTTAAPRPAVGSEPRTPPAPAPAQPPRTQPAPPAPRTPRP